MAWTRAKGSARDKVPWSSATEPTLLIVSFIVTCCITTNTPLVKFVSMQAYCLRKDRYPGAIHDDNSD